MVRFLAHRGLLSLADFSPRSSLRAAAASSHFSSSSPSSCCYPPAPDRRRLLVPVDALLAALRSVPAYQVDRNHTNCGLRARLLPVLDFVAILLSAGSVPVSRAAWAADRAAEAWMPPPPSAPSASSVAGARGGAGGAGPQPRWRRVGGGSGGDGSGGGGGGDDDDDDDEDDPRPFRFGRAMLGLGVRTSSVGFEYRLGLDKFAREVLTASSWNWTAEDD